MTETTKQTASAAAGGLPGFVHIAPFRVLAAVWVTLLVLTWVTVAATGVDLGRFNLWLAMAIATVKASLVLLYFMHMRYDRPINAIVFVTALLFVMLFVGFALMDTLAYQPELIPGYAPGIER
jgi:cytochrome c oxidase subunit 4